MYDDLARTQRRGVLELLVINALIPSVLTTLVLHPPSVRAVSHTQATFNPDFAFLPVTGCPDCIEFDPIPDAFPILLKLPRPVYPATLRRAGIEGHVRLEGLVDRRGRVISSSIVTLYATDSGFIRPARRAFAHALYRPARYAGKPIGYWAVVNLDFGRAIEFTPKMEAGT